MNFANTTGITALTRSFLNKKAEVAKLLIQDKRIDLLKASKSNQTPMWYAAKYGTIEQCKMMLDTKQEGLVQSIMAKNTSGKNALSAAKTEGKDDVFTYLKKKSDKLCPVITAIKNENFKLVKTLLEKKNGNINEIDAGGATPLIHACIETKSAIVKYLLGNENININIVDENGLSAIHHALKSENAEIAKLIINAPTINLLQPDNYNKTPIWYASKFQDIDIVKLLLSKKNIKGLSVSILIQTTPGGSNTIKDAKNDDIKKILTEETETISSELKECLRKFKTLIDVVKSGTVNDLKLIIEEAHQDINLVDSENNTALITACRLNKKDMVEYLLQNDKCDVNKLNKFGNTGLHWALGNSMGNNETAIEISKLLIQHPKSDLTLADKSNQTTVWFASKFTNIEVVKLMFNLSNDPKLPASILTKSSRGNNAITDAKNEEIKVFLNKVLADKNIENVQESTELKETKVTNETEKVEDKYVEWIKLDFEKDIEILRIFIYNKPEGGIKNLQNAKLQCINRQKQIIATIPFNESKVVQSFGFGIGEDGKTPFHVISKFKDITSIFTKLTNLDNSTELMLTYDSLGYTPLLSALKCGAPKATIKKFIEFNKDSIRLDVLNNLKNSDDGTTTPLHLAFAGNYDKQLIEQMAERRKEAMEVLDSDGRKPFMCRPSLYGDITNITPTTTIDEIRDILHYDPDALTKEYNSSTLKRVQKEYGNKDELVKAAKSGNLQHVKILIDNLKNPEDINERAQTVDNNTALSRAAASGHIEICKLLIVQDKIDVNKGGYKNRSPLLMCSWEGHIDIVQALLLHPDIKDSLEMPGELGNRPVSKAQNSKIKKLIQHKIDTIGIKNTASQSEFEKMKKKWMNIHAGGDVSKTPTNLYIYPNQ